MDHTGGQTPCLKSYTTNNPVETIFNTFWFSGSYQLVVQFIAHSMLISARILIFDEEYTVRRELSDSYFQEMYACLRQQ